MSTPTSKAGAAPTAQEVAAMFNEMCGMDSFRPVVSGTTSPTAATAAAAAAAVSTYSDDPFGLAEMAAKAEAAAAKVISPKNVAAIAQKLKVKSAANPFSSGAAAAQVTVTMGGAKPKSTAAPAPQYVQKPVLNGTTDKDLVQFLIDANNG